MFISFLEDFIPDTYVAAEDVIDSYAKEKALDDANLKNLISHYTTNLALGQVSKSIARSDVEMLDKVLLNFFEKAAILPEEIDGIIVVQETMNYQKDNIGHYLQYKYKMKNAFVFNLTGNHCLNFELGLKTAKGLMLEQEDIDNVLLVSVQRICQDHKRLIGKYAMLGDGAGLSLLTRKKGKIEYISSLMSASGKVAHNEKSIDDNYLLHYRKLSSLVKKNMEKYGISKGKITKVFIPNTNPIIYTSVLDKLGIDQQKIFINEAGKAQGHLTSLDLMVNLKSFINSPHYEKEAYLLALGFGVAGNYQSVIFKTN